MRVGLGADPMTTAINAVTGLYVPAGSAVPTLKVPASVAQYNFTDGLSNDSSLPAYLQSLTPTQLANALNGQPDYTGIAAALQLDQANSAAYLAAAQAAADPGKPPIDWSTIALLGIGVVGLLVITTAVKR